MSEPRYVYVVTESIVFNDNDEHHSRKTWCKTAFLSAYDASKAILKSLKVTEEENDASWEFVVDKLDSRELCMKATGNWRFDEDGEKEPGVFTLTLEKIHLRKG